MIVCYYVIGRDYIISFNKGESAKRERNVIKSPNKT